MYKKIYTNDLGNNKHDIHLWDDKGYHNFKWTNEVYKECNEHSKTHIGLKGEYLRKVKDWNEYDNHLHFHDMFPHQKYLVEKYYNNHDVPVIHKEIFFDIETEMLDEFTNENIKLADKKITAIAYYYKQKDKWVILIVDKNNYVKRDINTTTEIITFTTEYDLLIKFVELINEIEPDIFIGWNSDFFDIPYTYHRMCNVIGEELANSLSPINKVEVRDYNQLQPVRIIGIESLDYFRLHQKYSQREEESMNLGKIGEKYVNLGKIEYKGTLDDLYKNDINKYIDYNLIDVKILVELDKTFNYISLTKNICHKGKLNYSEIYADTRIHDGAISSYVLSKNLIPPSKDKSVKRDPGYKGAFLFTPKSGLYNYMFDLDLVSLYPSIIMSLNIGHETYVSRIINDDTDDDRWSLKELKEHNDNIDITIEFNTLERKEVKIKDLIKYIESNDFTITPNGTIYSTKEQSVLSSVLNVWFKERVKYKDKMKEYKKNKDKENANKYHIMQYTMKILLNSLYGATALSSFRYGNILIAASITSSARRIIQE